MKVTPDDADRLVRTPGAKVLGVVLPEADLTHGSGVAPRYTLPDDGMNKGERAYADHLEMRKRAGEIVEWAFEPEKFRLADNTFLCVDFRILLPDGTVRFADVKGRKKGGYYADDEGNGFHVEEDAWL
jgi:hypothetical protein